MYAYDLSGKLVNLPESDFPGINSGNLPAGYYASPYQAALARGAVSGPADFVSKRTTDPTLGPGGTAGHTFNPQTGQPVGVIPVVAKPAPVVPATADIDPPLIASETTGRNMSGITFSTMAEFGKAHWEAWGQREGRAFPASGNFAEYVAIHPDLAAAWEAAKPAAQKTANSTHVYVGRSASGTDVYRLTDEDGQDIWWEVAAGDNSAAMIPGSASRVPIPTGEWKTPPPTPATPAETTPTTTPATTITTRDTADATGATPDPRHMLVGKDVTGNNVYRLTDDAGMIVEWAVRPGDDSRNPIPGTTHYLNASLSNTIAVAAVPVGVDPGTTPNTTAQVSGFSIADQLPKIAVAALIAYLTR